MTNAPEKSVSGSTNTRTVTQRVRQPSPTKTLTLQMPLLNGSMGNNLKTTQSKYQSHKERLQLVGSVGEEDVVEVEVAAETGVAVETEAVEEEVVVVAQVVTTGYAETARTLTSPVERNVIAAKRPKQAAAAVQGMAIGIVLAATTTTSPAEASVTDVVNLSLVVAAGAVAVVGAVVGEEEASEEVVVVEVVTDTEVPTGADWWALHVNGLWNTVDLGVRSILHLLKRF